MREILFKAKGQTDDKWHIGFLANLYGGICIIRENEHEWICKPETICQYTGLKDKNGNLVWENDIVEAWSQGMCAIGKIKHRIDGTWIMYPAWQNGEMWYLLPNDNGITTVEIIGNIFDNPELMNE